MASQYGTNRIYTDKTEKTDARKTLCPLCKVYVVPRGLTSTRTVALNPGTHCPNCGHVFSPIRPESPAE